MKGSTHLNISWVCKNPPMIRVDLDSNPISRRSPRATTRRAKTKSRIQPRLFASSARLKGIMLDLAHWRKSTWVRSNKGRGLKVKLKLNLKLKIGHFPIRIKINLPKWRNQWRRERGALVATYVVRRGTLPLHVQTVPYLTLSLLMMIIYSLGKDKDGNMFAKFVGTQSGVKKRTIWVAKPIVTNLLGPNLVGDQQAQTWSIGVFGGHWRLGYLMKN